MRRAGLCVAWAVWNAVCGCGCGSAGPNQIRQTLVFNFTPVITLQTLYGQLFAFCAPRAGTSTTGGYTNATSLTAACMKHVAHTMPTCGDNQRGHGGLNRTDQLTQQRPKRHRHPAQRAIAQHHTTISPHSPPGCACLPTTNPCPTWSHGRLKHTRKHHQHQHQQQQQQQQQQ